MGATMSSETTAAAEGQVGRLRRDPMAMSPFIGYHLGDYLSHWFSFGKNANLTLPKIYHVNWFRTGSRGEFLWPGFGENIRALDWIVKRLEGEAKGSETPIGNVPDVNEFDIDETSVSKETLRELITVKKGEWVEEVGSHRDYFKSLGEKIPVELESEIKELEKRLKV